MLGCAVRRRFSIQRSRSARDVHPKDQLPSAVMIWGQGGGLRSTQGCLAGGERVVLRAWGAQGQGL